jgi:asparagine synthase (glutamine-hydrolysing)
MSAFTPEMKGGLYSADFTRTVAGSDSFDLVSEKFRDAEVTDSIDAFLATDVEMYLPDDLLIKMDIASMANSLEARSPFLDHELMEFAARIPASHKLRGRTTKHILKESLRGILPDEILFREKMGFAVPLDHWFRNDLKEMAYDLLLGKRSCERGYFCEGYVRKMLDEHAGGKWNWQHQIYNLLMLELWQRSFIDEAPCAGVAR